MYVLHISFSSKFCFYESQAYSFDSLAELSVYLNSLLTTPDVTVHNINIGPLSKPIFPNLTERFL